MGKVKLSSAVLGIFAIKMVTYSANTRCVWIGHQPKMPEEVKKFKRF